jgi:uncharacterized OsmC-like protein
LTLAGYSIIPVYERILRILAPCPDLRFEEIGQVRTVRPRHLPGGGAPRSWGTETAACSGDLVPGALVACAQLTCEPVAAAMRIRTQRIKLTVDGDMDLQGTFDVSKEVTVGFAAIRLQFNVDAPQALPDQLRLLREKREQYCEILQTLLRPPRIDAR